MLFGALTHRATPELHCGYGIYTQTHVVIKEILATQLQLENVNSKIETKQHASSNLYFNFVYDYKIAITVIGWYYTHYTFVQLDL